ncbi:MAG TPA: hypothetical protein V6C96_00555 [Vampirovibrionales bacterium]
MNADRTPNNTEKKAPNCYYVLGWEQPNTKVAILCKKVAGPVICETWKESLKLRTKLLNDKRTSQNTNAQSIISSLRIYRLPKGEALFWRPGDLWVYVDRSIVELLEV